LKTAGKIEVGNKVPHFVLPDQNGKLIELNDLLKEGPAVIYFYPKDHTPGCTREACAFRDQFQDFTDMGAQVIGISADSAESHRKFRDRHQLPFILLSDQDKKVQKLFGVPRDLFGLIPGRITYIVDQDGTIRHIFNSQLQFSRHVEESLKILRSLS